MVLGKVKIGYIMASVVAVRKEFNRDGAYILFDMDFGVEKICFHNDVACDNAFEVIWNNLSAYGYCDIDRISRKTGMVMR